MASVSFLGVHTPAFDAMRAHYAEGLALPVVHEGPDAVWFGLDDGGEIHVYRATDAWHAFFGTSPVPGILVDDLAAVQERLSGLGVEWLTEIQVAGGREWRHYRAADGNVYEIMGQVASPET